MHLNAYKSFTAEASWGEPVWPQLERIETSPFSRRESISLRWTIRQTTPRLGIMAQLSDFKRFDCRL